MPDIPKYPFTPFPMKELAAEHLLAGRLKLPTPPFHMDIEGPVTKTWPEEAAKYKFHAPLEEDTRGDCLKKFLPILTWVSIHGDYREYLYICPRCGIDFELGMDSHKQEAGKEIWDCPACKCTIRIPRRFPYTIATSKVKFSAELVSPTGRKIRDIVP